MKRKKSSKLFINIQKKVIFLCLIVVIGAVLNGIVKDWVAIASNLSSKKKLEKEYQELKEQQEVLEQEVIKLQDEEYVLRYAREKYGYSKDGELIIRINEK